MYQSLNLLLELGGHSIFTSCSNFHLSIFEPDYTLLTLIILYFLHLPNEEIAIKRVQIPVQALPVLLFALCSGSVLQKRFALLRECRLIKSGHASGKTATSRVSAGF